MKLYDDFAAAHPDPTRRSALGIADGASEFHLCQDAAARVDQREGQLMMRLSSFRTGHDVFQELDNRKQYMMSRQQWLVAEAALDFNARIAACCSGNPDDFGHGTAGFGILAMEEGRYFELRTNGFFVWSIAAIVSLPGQLSGREEALELQQLQVETQPFQLHQFGIVLDPLRRTVDYYVDRLRVHSYDLPGEVPQLVRVGFGLATHIPIANGRSSSCHGQGGEIRFGPCWVPDDESGS